MSTRTIPPPPVDVRECRVYRELRTVSQPSDGLVERVEAFLVTVTPLLELVIAGPFQHYTLHNPGHAKKLLHLTDQILPEESLGKLSALELAVLVMSAHLHDLGMVLTSTERFRVLASEEFAEHLRSWPELFQQLQAARAKHATARPTDQLFLEAHIYQLQDAALASFLRPRHAQRDRYANLIEHLKESSGRADLFQVSGVSFENELIDICVSHNLDPGVLLESRGPYEDRFPRAVALAGHVLNSQFCAAVLRLTDILDLDRERTPRVLFESIGIAESVLPGSDVSLREWSRHLALHSMTVSDDELVISADSHHPAIERAILDFAAAIEREIRDTLSVLRKNPQSIVDRYRIELPISVRARVRSIGYTYREFAFRLDQTSISTLLMGESLYGTPYVAFRELVQNAVDACRVRQIAVRDEKYAPAVTVSSERDAAGRTWLVVADNGIGMDEHVLSTFFFSVGNSFYTSPEFTRMVGSQSFSPISRFGIGMLSVFMIGDVLEVSTRNAASATGDTVFRRLRIDGRFGMAVVTEFPDGPQGTTVRVRLNEPLLGVSEHVLKEGALFLRKALPRPSVPVSIRLPPREVTLTDSQFVRLSESAIESLQVRGIEVVVLDLKRWSERLSGWVVLFLGVGSPTDGGQPGLVNVRISEEQKSRLLIGYGGNRITVNGVAMSLKRLGRVVAKGFSRTSAVLDVELRGDARYQYDVARQRIVGTTAILIRDELRGAIKRGLRDTGIAARLRPGMLDLDEGHRAPTAPDPAFLVAVRNLLPKTAWPTGVHRLIADELGVSASKVWLAIGYLLESGEVIRPIHAAASEDSGV